MFEYEMVLLVMVSYKVGSTTWDPGWISHVPAAIFSAPRPAVGQLGASSGNINTLDIENMEIHIPVLLTLYHDLITRRCR